MTQIKNSGLFSPDRGRDLMRRLAWACVLLMAAVVAASAWLRLAQPRPPCDYWPACRFASGPAPSSGPASSVSARPGILASPGVIGATRAVHRVAASIVLPITLALAVLALTRGRRRHRAAGLALALLGLAVGLALLGVVTPGSRAPPVLLGNMLGGLLMLGLAWRLVRRLGTAPAVGRSLARGAAAGAGVLIAQAALGVLSGAGIGAVPAVAHVALAFVSVAWMTGVGHAARRQGRATEGRALVALAVTQVFLGTAAFLSAAQSVLVLAHDLVAAAGLALLLGLGGAAANAGGDAADDAASDAAGGLATGARAGALGV